MIDFCDIPDVAPEPITMAQGATIENLLRSAALDGQQRDDIESSINDMTAEQGEQMITYLLSVQLDKIESGMNYNISDITRKIFHKLLDPKA